MIDIIVDKKPYTFKSSWNEVYIDDFQKFMDIDNEKSKYHDKLSSLTKEFNKYLELQIISEGKKKSKAVMQLKKLDVKIADVKNSILKLNYSEIEIFTDYPISEIIKLDVFSLSNDSEKNLITWLTRLDMLATSPLPKENIYRKLKCKSINIKGRKFVLLDIWEQTTIVNKDLRELSDVIHNEMNNGDYSNLITLIAYLVIEGTYANELNEIKSDNNARSYIDRYSTKIKELHDRTVKDLKELKIDIATCLRIVNFFFTQVEEMISAYDTVLKNNSQWQQLVVSIIEFVKGYHGVEIKKIAISINEKRGESKTRIKQMVNQLQKLKVFNKDKRGMFSYNDEITEQNLDNAISSFELENKSKSTVETTRYYNIYGFDNMVANVSKWKDHQGVIIREYAIDSLWVGRYVDFLDKAKEWLLFIASEKSIIEKIYAKKRTQNNE